MKRTVSILLILALLMSVFPFSVFAQETAAGTTYYIDSLNGNDALDGMSESNAWKSASRINAVTFQPGDKILLKCGSVFNCNLNLSGSGTKENPITISSYGEGDKPLLTTMLAKSVIEMINISYWTIENIEFTAPNGGGIFINTPDRASNGISILNCVFHDIQFEERDHWAHGVDSVQSAAAIQVKYITSPSPYAVNDLTIKDCEIYETTNGVLLWGSWNRAGDAWCILKGEMPDVAYNDNIVIDGCSFYNLKDTAMIMGMCKNSAARNCSVINTCQCGTGKYYTAPFWMWGSTHCVIENTEISGSKNEMDGMSVDFDSHTNNSTYQYIYSHDNVRFMWNCVYGETEYDSVNNMVRYCLSVNDNVTDNGEYSYEGTERNFKFYNNTIVNGSSYNFDDYSDAVIKNNIFVLKLGSEIKTNKNYQYDFSNNCYYDVGRPIVDRKSIQANPQFAGTDKRDMNSFKLKKCSPCIGAGVQVEEDMGERDLYGNPLSSVHNIGCYEGEGLDGAFERETLRSILCKIYTSIYNNVLNKIVNEIEHIAEWLKKQIAA